MVQQNEEKSTPFYDVVIIGAGISGLFSATLLSKAGLSVCVLEKNAHPGGYLTGYKRFDYRFDTAIHWLNQCGPDGMVTKFFDLIGKDHPVSFPQKSIRNYIKDTTNYLLTNNPDELKNQLIKEYPREKKGIEKFFATAKKLGDIMNSSQKFFFFRAIETMGFFEKIFCLLNRLKFALSFIKYINYSGTKGVTRGLNKFFKDKKLHALFPFEPDLLSCLIPVGWAYKGDFQNPPKGGSQAFPEWLSYVVNFYENDIRYSAKVNRILVEKGNCKGVSYEYRGEEYKIHCEQVIAACDVSTLYEKMLPQEVVPPKMIEKLRNSDIYTSALLVSVALDCLSENLGFNEESVFISKDNVNRGNLNTGDPENSEITVVAPSVRDKSLAPKGCGTLIIHIPALFENNHRWKTIEDENGMIVRGEAYKKLKKEYADILIRRVEERIAPGLREHIVHYDVATPITYWRYTGNRDGSMMGAKPGKKNIIAGIAHYKTAVKGLYLGGHWAELGGGVPMAVRAATNTALLVLKQRKHKAFKVYVDYFELKKTLEETLSSNIIKHYDNSWVQTLTPAQKRENA